MAELGVPYIMMHSRGLPGEMQLQENTRYPDGAVAITVANELREQIQKAVAAGVEAWRIIPDPGEACQLDSILPISLSLHPCHIFGAASEVVGWLRFLRSHGKIYPKKSLYL